jgi:uncharacterized protein YjbI with pentapeptide repeats
MANKEQVEIVEQGGEAWNRWREKNPDAKIDLRGAKLKDLDLSCANFRCADIRTAIFRNCNLREADFSEADLRYNSIGFRAKKIWFIAVCGSIFLDWGVKVLAPSLSFFFSYHIPRGELFTISQYALYVLTATPILGYTSDIYSKYSKKRPYMTGFIYYRTDFPDSDLSYAKFKESSLSDNSYKNSILADKDVRELLTTGERQTRSLKGKNLKSTCLVNFNLRETDLRETDLRQADLSGADITGAKLWGSARGNWIINGIRCDYFYWGEAGKKRIPPEDDRNFYPGEFEDWCKQLPTFEYIFEQGFSPLDPQIMERVVHAINERYKDFKLELVNFDKRDQPHATFTVCRFDYIDEAKREVAQLYERIKYLERENEDKKRRINISDDVINQLIKKIPSSEGLKLGDTNNFTNCQIAAVGSGATATENTFFQQVVNDLFRLHEEMRNKAETPKQQAAAEDIAKAEQAARQQDEQTMQQHLKNAGQWALDCAQKVGTDVLTEYLKKVTIG